MTTAMVLAFCCGRVWVARTCSTSLVPMPKARQAQRPVGGGVRVPADDGHAGLGHPQFGSDHVDDALVLVASRKHRDAELATVLIEHFELALARWDRPPVC